MDMNTASIKDVELAFRWGDISYEAMRDYIRKWNAGPHFSQAIWSDGKIRLFDPEKAGPFYRHFKDEFGLRL